MKIIQGDCLEEMKKMEDNSVDVVITSPPYFVSNRNKGKKDTINYQKNKMELYNTKYLNPEHYDDFLAFLINNIDEMLRVSKNLVLINFQPVSNSSKYFWKMVGHYSDKIYDIFTWVKKVSQPQSHEHYISRYTEFVMILSKTGKCQCTSKHLKNYYIGNPNLKNKYTSIHGAVMADDFCKKLVYEFSRKGDIVLDPFSGMGTTGCYCKVLDREYIGIEKEPRYVEESIKRINEFQHQQTIQEIQYDLDNDYH